MSLRPGALVAAFVAVAGCARSPVRHEVEIREMAFVPAVVEVVVGDTVVWVNRDLFPHTSTVDGMAGWDTREIPADSSRSAVPVRAGTYDYVCRVHPTMRGRVVVLGP